VPKAKEAPPVIGDSTTALRVPHAEPEQRTGACLVVIKGREIGRDFRLRRKNYVMGRDPDLDIPVHDDSVSRRHAQIEVLHDPNTHEPHYWLSDLQSTNHTFVNGKPIERVELRDGDKIRVGETILKFALLDEVEARFHREIRDRIRYDSLTGLLTRDSVFMALEVELRRAITYRQPLSVLMMDLDRFKRVNDTHGHLVGSRVLTLVGRIIRENLRVVDVSGRYGGEEFITYLAETTPEMAVAAAERIRKGLACQCLRHGKSKVRITISIGVASYPEHGSNVTSLVACADSALYQAKESGRNRVIRAV
jgi:diguanylate cyclase (GGDEF)-like protein